MTNFQINDMNIAISYCDTDIILGSAQVLPFCSDEEVKSVKCPLNKVFNHKTPKG